MIVIVHVHGMMTFFLFFVAFSREHSVRLENASVLKGLIQNNVVGDKAIAK